MNKEKILSQIKEFLDKIPVDTEITDFYISGYDGNCQISIVISPKTEEAIDILGDYERYMTNKLDIPFCS